MQKNALHWTAYASLRLPVLATLCFKTTMQIANLIEPGFSTADAEYPEIKQEDGDLTLRFKDWQEKLVEVFFGDAIAFKWQMAESFLANERDDCSYEIEGSEWLELHRKQGEILSLIHI